ncbi:MAG TPA: isopeptide-forming domain-containing fimbrial protein, partial [Amycolatopsis sp.]|nr:isopeptide-forming domain-containing fimbrial protein [Amycolatopsis sp.]
GSFIFASATFVFTTGPDIQITPHGSSSTERVSVMEFAVSNGTLFAGAGASVDAGKNLVDGTGIKLTSINIAAVLLTDDDPAIVQPRTYFALKASGTAHLVGLSGFEFDGSVTVEVNDATVNGARGPPAADFTRLAGGGLSVPTDLLAQKSVLVDFSDAVLKVTGSVTIAIQKFAFITGSFTLDFSAFEGKGPTNIALDNGDTGPATVITFGLSNAYAFFGTRGPYWVMNQDGSVTQVANNNAMGLAVTNVSFALALVDPTAGSSLGSVDHVQSAFGLKASGSVALVGISGFNASIQNATIVVDQSTPTLGHPSAPGINFKGGDYAPNGLTIGSTTLDMTGTDLSASGQVTLSIGNFFYLSGAVTFRKQPLANIQLSNGSTIAAATAMTISASGVEAFAGINGPGSNPQALGLKLTNVNFGLFLLSPDSATSTGSYYALKASVGGVQLVGISGVTLSITNLELDVNGSSGVAAGTVVDFTKGPFATTPISFTFGAPPNTSTVTLDFTSALLRASGMVTLGFGPVSVTADVFVQVATRADQTTTIAVILKSFSFTLGPISKTFGPRTDKKPVGAIFITGQGTAAEFNLQNVSFNVGTNVQFTAPELDFAINTSGQAVNETFQLDATTSWTLQLPGGPYFRLEADNTTLVLAIGTASLTITGSYLIQQQTVNGATETVIAASKLNATGTTNSCAASSCGSASAVTFTITNGNAAMILRSGGMAAAFSGGIAVNIAGFVQAGATQAELDINNTTANVNETVVVGGSPILVNIAAGAYSLTLTNVSVKIGSFLTLTGNFHSGSANESGATFYGAAHVEAFLGAGPYRNADGTVNPKAIGVLITDASLAIVKFGSADGSPVAIHGTGTAALVGLPGLTLSGTVTVDVNDTGQAVNDSYTFTDGTSVSITFATGTHVEGVTGTNLTIDAAGIFKIKGNVVFNLKPGGRVDVDVTSAEISLSVPIN